MDLHFHVAATELTARYPEAGTGTTAALAYVALGLAGETSEALEKLVQEDRAGLAAELGDVLWYAARLYRELDLTPEADSEPAGGRSSSPTELPDAMNQLLVRVGRVSEALKKAVRDDAQQVSEDRHGTLCTLASEVVSDWLVVVHAAGLDSYAVAAANIAKLLGRRDRGVLAGSGDHR